MRFYIASKFEERLKVRWLMDRLEDLGHEITHDWTGQSWDDSKNLTQYALDAIQGVRNAECIVGVFIEDCHYQGSIGEVVLALADNIPTYIIGHAIDSCIFTKLATKRFETEMEFLNFIGRLSCE